ncbi:hypothetical protein [Winogradskyella sp.]|uniref:hypothetical protein n=1 Tax=Winogradskyella sp. TaxID=1883156 RepID=UPI0025E5E50B|nr:hypothetical protein [Winogradskyella sp.]
MKKTILVLFSLFLVLNVFGQRRRNTNNIPQANSEPSERDIAKQKREMEERKNEYIATFLTTLEADDFQKQIIKQYLNSYNDARFEIIKTKFEHRIDREAAIKKLEETHFIELKELISESDMSKIQELIKGNFKEKEVLKEKKKKKKRKKKRKKDKG